MRKYENLDCILLVDDDSSTNFINERIIRSANIETHVQVCESGQEALDYLNCEGEFSDNLEYPQPGIIFLDINMPGMNGWEFLEHYEELPGDRKAKVVVAMLTTSANPDDKDNAQNKESVKSFFMKPLTVDYLYELINQYFS